MCDYCDSRIDVGWLKQKDGTHKSVCFACGLTEEGEFVDRR